MEKSPEAFRTISEVAEFLETPAHVLRFWESRFPQIRPVKRAGGRRYYRPSDVALLSGIKRLLHEDGLTIRGVQKILQEQGVKHVAGLIDEEAEASIAAEQETAPAEPIPLFPTIAEQVSPPEAQPRLFDDPPEAEAVRASDDRATSDSASVEPDPITADKPLQTTSDPDATEVMPDTPAIPYQPERITEEGAAETTSASPMPLTEAADEADGADGAEEKSDHAPLAKSTDSAMPPPAQPTTDDAASVPFADDPESSVVSPASHSAPNSPENEQPPAPPPSMPPAQAPADAPPAPPGPLVRSEAPARWHAADLRALRATALHGKADQAEALAQRLRILRDKLAAAGRATHR